MVSKRGDTFRRFSVQRPSSSSSSRPGPARQKLHPEDVARPTRHAQDKRLHRRLRTVLRPFDLIEGLQHVPAFVGELLRGCLISGFFQEALEKFDLPGFVQALVVLAGQQLATVWATGSSPGARRGGPGGTRRRQPAG
jgi:hypothetical protein